MVNKVILIGNVGKKPEFRTLTSGDRVASFSLATSERWRDKTSGERKEVTDWHNVVVFAQPLVEVLERYVDKGSKLFVEGQMKTREWEKDGVKRYTTEVVVKAIGGAIQLLDRVESNRPPPADGYDSYGKSSDRSSGRSGGGRNDDFDDEIPF